MIREQPMRVRTGSLKKRLYIIAALLLIVLLAGALYRIILYEAPYVPPDFDLTAQIGVPDPPKNMNYGEINVQNGFSFSVAGTMYQQEDSSLYVYLTNPGNSGINMMCEVKDTEGNTLYKSGVIRPGEYVERLSPLEELPNKAMKIEMYVYAFEPDTWYSEGTVNLTNTLQPY